VVKLKKPVVIDGKLYYEEVAEDFPTEQYVPPNPTTTIFMMKNRLPEQYKDKHEVEHSGVEFSIKLPENMERVEDNE